MSKSVIKLFQTGVLVTSARLCFFFAAVAFGMASSSVYAHFVPRVKPDVVVIQRTRPAAAPPMIRDWAGPDRMRTIWR
jgi:hypothetical protein